MTMKRRLKSNIKCPLTSAIGDFARNQGFENPCDTRKAKRVRFGDGAPVLASSGGCEAIQSSKCGAPKTSEYAYFRSMKCGAVRDRSCAQREENDQKNSKTNYLVRETSSASDKLKPSTDDPNFSVSGGSTGPSNHNRFHSPCVGKYDERAGSSDRNRFHSPCVSKYDESDQIRSKELTNQIRKRSSLLSENVTPVGQSLFSSPLNKESEKAENQCSEKGIFSAKRQRLRQWAHSSLSEVEKFNLKGFDLVPLLLSRLFPKGNENNDSSKGDTVKSCKSPTVSKSNDLENRLDVSHKRDWDNDLPKACSGSWSDIVLAEQDKFISGFPSNYRKENHLPDELIDPDKRSKSHKYSSSHTRLGFPLCLPFESQRSSGSSHHNDLDEFIDPDKRSMSHKYRSSHTRLGFPLCLPLEIQRSSGSSHHNDLDEFIDPDKRSMSHKYRSSHTGLGFPLCLPFESYRSSGSSHLNDLDEFGSIIEHQREPYGLLLEWDNELGQDRLDSSIVNHGIEKNVYTRLDNSWNVDQWGIVDNGLDANTRSSSLSAAYYLESNTGPSYTSKGCLIPDFGPAFEDVKCAMGEPEQFSLALPYAPECITLGEDKNGENVLSNSNIVSSYRDEDWLNKKVWDGEPLRKFGWKCISPPEDYPSVFHPSQFLENENRLCSVSRLKEASVEEPFTPLFEGVFNPYFLSSIPQSSLNTFINPPLLLDHVSEDSPDQELYFDEVMNWDSDKYFRCTYGDSLC
ncbi:hypothetical protein ACS0TY_025765 [Phlomoides rotata]